MDGITDTEGNDDTNGTGGNDEDTNGTGGNNTDLDDDDLAYLLEIENKIKEMKLQWAQEEGDDAAFIESKIRDMEEFLADAKQQLGLEEDTDMVDAAKIKKRGREDVIDGEEESDASGGGVGGFLERIVKVTRK